MIAQLSIPGFFETIKKAGQSVLTWFVDWIRETGEALTQTLFDSLDLTGVPAEYITWLSDHAASLNYVFPLYETIGMLSAFVQLVFAVMAIKLVLRFLPFG